MSADIGRVTKLVVDKTIVLIFDRKYIVFVSSEYCLGKGQYGKVYEGAEIPSYFQNSSSSTNDEIQNVYNNYKRLENDDLSSDVGDEGSQDLNTRIKRRKLYPQACKRVNLHRRSEKERELLRQEAHLLSKYRHSNIIGYYGDYTVNNEIFIIMERCDEDLEQYMRRKEGVRQNENALCVLMNQMLDGLHYLHTCVDHIIHRDLKPQNVFLKWVCLCELSGAIGCREYLQQSVAGLPAVDTSQLEKTLCYTDEDLIMTDAVRRNDACECVHMFPLILLGDLGMARITEEAALVSTECGTPLYSAPESAGGRYSAKVDMWALGLVFKYLAGAGRNPLDARNRDELKEKQRNMNFDVFQGYSEDMVVFARKLLEYDPEQRYDSTQSVSHWKQYNPVLTSFVTSLQAFLRSVRFSVQRVEELTVSAVKNRIHKVQSRDSQDQFYSLEEVKEAQPTLGCAEQVKLLSPRLKNKTFALEDFYACVVANVLTVNTLYELYRAEAVTMNNILDLVIYEQLPQLYLLLYSMVMVLPIKAHREHFVQIIVARQVNIVPLICIAWNILSICPDDPISWELLTQLDLSCLPSLLQQQSVLEGVSLLNHTFKLYVELNECLRQTSRDKTVSVPLNLLEQIVTLEKDCGSEQAQRAAQASGSATGPGKVQELLMDMGLIQEPRSEWGHCGLNYTAGLQVGTGGVASLLTSRSVGIDVLCMPLPHMPPSFFLYTVYEDMSCITHQMFLQTLPPVLLLALVDNKLIPVDTILLWIKNLSQHRNTLLWFQRYRAVLDYYVQSKVPVLDTIEANPSLVQLAIEASKQLHQPHEGTPQTVATLICQCKEAQSLLWCCAELQNLFFPDFCPCSTQAYLRSSVLAAVQEGKNTKHVLLRQNGKSAFLHKPKKTVCNITSLVDFFTSAINNAHTVCESMTRVLSSNTNTNQPWIPLLNDAHATLSKHIRLLLPELITLQAWGFLLLVDAHLYAHLEYFAMESPPALPMVPQDTVKHQGQNMLTAETHQTRTTTAMQRQTPVHTSYMSPEVAQREQRVACLQSTCSCAQHLRILALQDSPPKFKSAFVLTQRSAQSDQALVQYVLNAHHNSDDEHKDASVNKKLQLLKHFLRDHQQQQT